jgi:hypothetical protein
MKRLLILFALLLVPAAALAQVAALPLQQCLANAGQATVQGLSSTNYQQKMIPSCTVTIYLTGTTTPATYYLTPLGSPQTGPFTASSTGQWIAYLTQGQGYDVVLSGGIAPNTYPAPVTFTDIFSGGSSGVGGGGNWIATLGQLTAAITAAGSTPTTLICDGTIALTGNLTIPENISMVYYPPCQFTGAYTLTVNGPIEWLGGQVYGNGLKVNFATNPNSPPINPIMWGADPTATLDSATAWSSALAAAENVNGWGGNVNCSQGTYLINNSINYIGGNASGVQVWGPPSQNNNQASGSNLHWNGAPGGTIFHQIGGERVVVSGLNFQMIGANGVASNGLWVGINQQSGSSGPLTPTSVTRSGSAGNQIVTVVMPSAPGWVTGQNITFTGCSDSTLGNVTGLTWPIWYRNSTTSFAFSHNGTNGSITGCVISTVVSGTVTTDGKVGYGGNSFWPEQTTGVAITAASITSHVLSITTASPMQMYPTRYVWIHGCTADLNYNGEWQIIDTTAGGGGTQFTLTAQEIATDSGSPTNCVIDPPWSSILFSPGNSLDTNSSVSNVTVSNNLFFGYAPVSPASGAHIEIDGVGNWKDFSLNNNQCSIAGYYFLAPGASNIQSKIDACNNVKIATFVGAFYGMANDIEDFQEENSTAFFVATMVSGSYNYATKGYAGQFELINSQGGSINFKNDDVAVFSFAPDGAAVVCPGPCKLDTVNLQVLNNSPVTGYSITNSASPVSTIVLTGPNAIPNSTGAELLLEGFPGGSAFLNGLQLFVTATTSSTITAQMPGLYSTSSATAAGTFAFVPTVMGCLSSVYGCAGVAITSQNSNYWNVSSGFAPFVQAVSGYPMNSTWGTYITSASQAASINDFTTLPTLNYPTVLRNFSPVYYEQFLDPANAGAQLPRTGMVRAPNNVPVMAERNSGNTGDDALFFNSSDQLQVQNVGDAANGSQVYSLGFIPLEDATGSLALAGTLSTVSGSFGLTQQNLLTCSTFPSTCVEGYTGNAWSYVNVAGACAGTTFIPDTTDVTAPDGTYTAIKMVTPAGCTFVGLYYLPSLGLTLGNNYTSSFYMRGAVGGELMVQQIGYTSNSPQCQQTTPTVLTTSWQEPPYTCLFSPGVTTQVAFEGESASSTYYIWGAQLNVGTKMLPYIGTTLSANQPGLPGVYTSNIYDTALTPGTSPVCPNGTAGALTTTGCSGGGGGTGSLVFISPSGDTTGATDLSTIQTQITAGNDIYLSKGNFYINGSLNWSGPSNMWCAGGTQIEQVSTTANFITVSYGGGLANSQSTGMGIRGCLLIYKSGVSPTCSGATSSGCNGVSFSGTSSSAYGSAFHFEDNIMSNIYGGVYVGNYVVNNYFTNNLFLAGSNSSYCVYINTPIPSGDTNFDGMQCTGSSNRANVEIFQSDTSNFTNLKVNGGAEIEFLRGGAVQRVIFTNLSCEGPITACVDWGTGGSYVPFQVQFNGGGTGVGSGTFFANFVPGMAQVSNFNDYLPADCPAYSGGGCLINIAVTNAASNDPITSGCPISANFYQGYWWNNTNGACTFNLPTPMSATLGGGTTMCFANGNGTGGTISLVPPSGVKIIYGSSIGTVGSATGLVSPNTATDAVCLVAQSATVYQAFGQGSGGWINH